MKRISCGLRYHHNVYVVQLDSAVLNERRFASANSGHDPRKACLYVGSTGLSPEDRLRNHQQGYKGNRFVRLYGLRLLPDFYECFNPMPYRAACEMEWELAEELRGKGFAVWQA